jgi:transcriptional regulator with GAF, ATPase, and Fis domain
VLRVDASTLAELQAHEAARTVDHVTIQNEGMPHPKALSVLPQIAGFSELKLKLDNPGEDVGVLILMKRGRDVYSERHAALLRSVREPIRIAMSNARRYVELLQLKERLADDNRAMHRELEQLSGTRVVGADLGLRPVMEMVRRVAPLSSPVLLLGETGSGKEVIANAIHLASPRHEQPFVRVPCGAIPEALLDSELFGHEKGAFTGALTLKRGRFERAEGGTVFLDEIGELTPEAQVKLLRVLQEKEFERLGGTQTLHADVRVIAATHRDLAGMVRAGTFREDLWFRLNVFPIYIPPLRQRREDIPSLIQFFIDRKTRELSLPPCPAVSAETLQPLLEYDWPGNVRELQNVVERALILSQGRPLTFPNLESALAGTPPTPEAARSEFPELDAVIDRHIRQALTKARGRVEGEGGAADLLGLNPSTLRARMRKLRIPFGRQALRWSGEQGRGEG